MHRQVGGSGWFRGDFNVHTPFSGCYLGQGVTARELLARGHGLDFMVIADHNSFDGYLNLLEHWEPGCPVLFPGVELKAAGGYGGLSFVVVLNPSYSPEELESFLRELNLSGTAKGDHDLVLPLSLPEVARVVRKYDGIVLWSKLDTPEGIFGGIDEGQRRYILSLDWPVMSFDLADSREGALCPGVWSSNAHRSGEIGKTSTMVKMAKLDFQGLKFALQDPQSRVRSGSAPRTIDYPQVISLKVQGGFLDGQEFLFNPGLNCLIGPRGTGKTTLLKLLGFALGKPAEGLEFLLGDGEVEVLLLNTEGEEVFLRRSLGQPPKSFDPWGRPLSFDPRSFGMFLAQGELEKVVLNPEFQLELLDSMWESGDDKAALEELALKLQDNYESMVKLEGEIEELQEQLAGKESLAQRLKELQDMPLGEIQQRLVQRDRELLYLDRLQQVIQQNLRLLKQLPFGQEMGGDSLLWKALEETRFAKDSLSVVWEAAEQELAERRAQAAERHRRLEAEYREFLGVVQIPGCGSCLKNGNGCKVHWLNWNPWRWLLRRCKKA